VVVEKKKHEKERRIRGCGVVVEKKKHEKERRIRGCGVVVVATQPPWFLPTFCDEVLKEKRTPPQKTKEQNNPN